jgi:hypothetical protein
MRICVLTLTLWLRAEVCSCFSCCSSKSLGTHCPLNVKTRCTFHTFSCYAIGLTAAKFLYFNPYFRLWQIPGFFFLTATIGSYTALWITTCKSLSTAGKSLSRNIKVWHRKLTLRMICDNRKPKPHKTQRYLEGNLQTRLSHMYKCKPV